MKTNQTQKNIPSDWQQVKLGDICDFKKGKGLPKDDLIKDGKYEAIHYGELFTKYHEKIEDILSKTNNNKNVFLSKKNDILMPTSDVTPRGLSTASFIDKDGVILGGDILVIRPKSNILNGLFFSNFVSSQKQEVIKLVSGTTVFHLYGSDMSKLKFNLPPLPEQNRIVSVLETWDKFVEKLAKKIELKKQIKKGLMQDLLTGKKRLRGFSDKWETFELGVVSKMSSGGTPKSTNESYYGGNIPWVSIADMTANGKFIYSTLKNLTKVGLDNSSAKIYPKGTILYAMYASIGECSIAGVEMSSSQAILGITPDKEKLDSMFLYYYLISIKERIKLLGQQGTQSNLNAGMVREFILDLPPINEQKKIVEILTTADNEITFLKNKLKKIKEQKRYLLNNLVTGTIRTPENLSIKS